MMPFLDVLENFRMEEESVQQFFFGYLSLQLVPGSNPAVLSKLNETPSFWITARYSLLVAAFVALGRIFDQDRRSVHNIDKLLRAVHQNIGIFTQAGLLQRKTADGMDPVFAAEYVKEKHDLTPADVKEMSKAVAYWRSVYQARYRDVRHLVFAHRGIPRADVDALMALTKIDEMKEMLGFLDALHLSLRELHLNGRKPDLTPTVIVLPPLSAYNGPRTAGERVYRESMDLQFGMLTAPHAD